MKTEKATVRLRLDIDKKQDAKTAYPWPWTPESGNLMYLMPEVGSQVSLYFGDDEEANGRAIHCVRDNAPKPKQAVAVAAPSSSSLAAAPSSSSFSAAAPSSSSFSAAAPSQSEPSSPDVKGQDFSPEDRSLTNIYGKSLFIEPDSIGITNRIAYVMLDGRGARVQTPSNIYIMAKGNITIEGDTVTLQCSKPYYPGGMDGGARLVYLCQGSIVVGDGGSPDLDAKAIIQTSSDTGGEVVVYAEQFTHFNATTFASWPRILDDPEEGVFDKGKFWTNVIIGVVIVVVISAVTLGVGALAGVTGCGLWLLGGSVLGTGLFYVGSTALADYQKGVVSDWTDYAMAALIGSAIGLINGLVPFIPGVGTSFLATVGSAFVTGTLGNVLDQTLTGEEIDWEKALLAGGFSALLAAVLFGVCFVAGTLVLTAVGYVAIENVKAGDLVYSENRGTGEKGLKRVLRTFVNSANQLVHVCMNGEKISCTPGHPFYVSGKGWTGAGQLCSGDEVVLQTGETEVVEAVQHEILDEKVLVYNFEVEEWHTYYVGANNIMVHNICDPGSAKSYSEHSSRNSAFRAAKRDAGIPMSQQPSSVLYVRDNYSHQIVGREYNFGSVVISEHGAGHALGGIGSHFNSSFLPKWHYLY